MIDPEEFDEEQEYQKMIQEQDEFIDEEEGEDEDYRTPNVAVDKDGNPMSPPPLFVDDSMVTNTEVVRTKRTNKERPTPTNQQMHKESITNAATTPSIIHALKATPTELNLSLTIELPQLDLLKSIKENSDLTDEDFLNFLSDKIDKSDVANAIYKLIFMNT